jgi:hypothetical protein
VVGLVALVVVGCAGGSPGSGVSGIVTIGPQCAVEQIGSPCPDLPFVGTVRASALDGTVVAEVETDERGRFRIALDPGDYVLQAVVDGAGPPTAVPQPVRVEEDRTVRVTLQVDSGIR